MLLERTFLGEVEHWKNNSVRPYQRNVYVGGMSQGGVTALNFGLNRADVGGVACFSGYLMKATELTNT